MVWYKIITGVAVFLSLIFTALIFFTGKGDAMSGGSSSVRTTFKGKASFDDKMFTIIMWLGAGFMVLMITLLFISQRVFPGA